MATSENQTALRTFGDGTLDDVPGRFSSSAELSGDIAEVEHLARYEWAARFAKGKRILDAGCGWAYGTGMFADAGAAKAVGIDLAPTVIEVAQQELGDKVELHVGDVQSLPFEDASFDVVVCFEVIEHLEKRVDVIAELKRVLSPSGLLLVSSPNRNRSVPGNPYHVHEYLPEEFRAELEGIFGNVRLYGQHNWVVSAVLDSDAEEITGLATVDGLTLHKGVAHTDGSEDYMVAVASDGPVPSHAPPVAVASSDVELRRWVELFAEQDRTLTTQHDWFQSLDIDRVAAMALALEDAAARESSLVAKIAELDRDLHKEVGVSIEREKLHAEQIAVLESHIAHNDRVRAEVFSSLSWRITAPLRKLKSLR